VYTFLK